MREEEKDVEWVRDTREAGLDLIFLDDSERTRVHKARKAGNPVVLPGRPEASRRSLMNGCGKCRSRSRAPKAAW
jgi:hypothetical protein